MTTALTFAAGMALGGLLVLLAVLALIVTTDEEA